MEKEKYTVYQYLKFIWDKKWYLLITTVLFMILGYTYSHKQEKVYNYQALVFTGNGQNDLLSKPDLIKSKYKVKAESTNLDIKIPGNFQITFNVTSNSSKKAHDQVKQSAEKYVKDLSKRFHTQFSAKKNYASSLKLKIDKLNEEIDQYNKLIVQSSDDQKLSYYTENVLQKEESLADYKEKLYKAQYQLSIMEKPELISVKNISQNGNSMKNAVLAGAFGFQLMLVIIVIWKYILDARRSIVS